MDIVGFAHIKKDAKSGMSAVSLDRFIGKDVRVMGFASDGGVLVVDDAATGYATFDKEDVKAKFECSIFSDIVCPPGLDFLGQSAYWSNCMNRKGGYNKMLCNMVIQASLMKGKFTDGFLWQLQ